MKSNYSFITIKNIVVLFAIFILLPNCNLDNKRIGTFGESEDINSSKSNHLFKARYTPNRFKLQLLDSSIIIIDTAWSEAAWTYNDDGKPSIAEDSGYNVIIPIPKMNDDKFNFELIMADTTKSMFEGAVSGPVRKRSIIYPKILQDTLTVLLEQMNTDTAYGWTRPLITDTIKFTKIK